MNDQTIESHLTEALSHLRKAIDQSLTTMIHDSNQKKPIAHMWETFLGQFFGYIREKGKESKINLLSLISFPRLK